ncbi:MAG: hypothetical protein Q7T62_04450 [Undibacterium sp.]|nr:hypothetical protein [Undibacterium sp.]
MVPEITILNLQLAASVLMGYDYFLSDALKAQANAFAADVVKTYQSQTDARLKAQAGIFRTWIPVIISGIVYATIGSAVYFLGKTLAFKGAPIELQIIGAVLMFAVIYFVWRASKQLIDAFTHGVLPFTIPAILRVIFTFLLYSSKGAIAALGMLFLVTSFLFRYSNAGIF